MDRFMVAVMSAAILCSCGDAGVPADEARDPITTSQKALVPNAYWELDMGANGVVSGDHVTVTLMSNSTSGAPAGLHVILRSTTNIAIAGSFTTTSYQPGGSYQTGIRNFNVSGGPSLLLGTPSSPVPSADITGDGVNNLSASFGGPVVFQVTPEGSQPTGDYTFALDAGLDGPIPETPQQPLPFNTEDEEPDPLTCPAWYFKEDSLGSRVPNPWHMPRTETKDLSGDEVKTGWDGSRFVIKFESNLQRPEFYGGEIILTQYPAQGVTGSYPATVVMAHETDSITWSSASAVLEVQGWSGGGVMLATINATDFVYNDSTELPDPNNPGENLEGVPPHFYLDTPVEMRIFAPLPQYNHAYDQLCEFYEENTQSVYGDTPAGRYYQSLCVAAFTAAEIKAALDAKKANDITVFVEGQAKALAIYTACMESARVWANYVGN
jgi:hypothetical protein